MRRAAIVGACAGLAAAAWLYALSGLMFVRPGSELTRRRDVLFQSDAGYWIAAYASGGERVSSFTHPLLGALWEPGPRLLYLALRHVLPDEDAVLVAGRAFTALVAAAGVAALFGAAARHGASTRVLALLLPVYLLFTDQILVSLPEHFALSQALLSIAFALLVAAPRPATQLAGLGLLAVAAGGVTVTNAVFPLAAAGLVVHRHVSPRRWRQTVTAVAVLGLVAAAALGAALLASPTARQRLVWRVAPWLTARPLRDPGAAGRLAFRGLVDPAIGPTPAVDRNNDWHLPMVTYQPTYATYALWPYDGLQSTAVVAWLLLLGTSVVRAGWDPGTRPYVGLLLGWIAFNTVLHNFWGDEYFLFSTHWSWALFALVLLAAPRLRWPAVACLTVALVAGQVHTLIEVRHVLAAIV
ncbi:MAG TPA: hypothetical protein VKW76_03325 [Candidatus Binatia bacterium]|nr:hypothetical protein [Candidatus Binatia bacterium]